jgi:nicotinamide-nucleotide amidase
MRLEVLNTGTELLLGSVLNTHTRLFAEALFPLGLRIARQVCVPDGEPIRVALAETFGRADIVLITGGLGPTTDDLTRDLVAELLGLTLEHDPEIWRQIEERFARRQLRMSARNQRQALRPPEATVLWNPHGTAPGLYLPPMAALKSPHLFLLPGPPRELRPMVADYVVPMLAKMLPPSPLAMRVWRTAGLGESHVEELVGEALLALGVELGYCARPGEVDVRIIGTPEQVEKAGEILHARLAAHIVSQDQRSLEKVVIDALAARGGTLATAESCTGGYIAHRLTNVPGASAVFLAGYVTYANEAKTRTLGVEAALLAAHGAVSAPVARAMAEGARAASGATHAVATTGIAGPAGGSAEKPVGTVFVALASGDAETHVERLFFPTDRERFKELTAQAALDLLRRTVAGRA